VTDPHNLEGVFSSIERIGEIVNRGNQAKQLVEQLRARADAVRTGRKFHDPGSGSFIKLYAEPLYTAGRDAFVTDLIRRAGGDSVTANVPGAWPNYSAESALASRPEAIILATGGASGDAKFLGCPIVAKISRRTEWKSLQN